MASYPTATIVADEDFNASTSCEELRTAFKGIGTDEDAVINILTRCNRKQRFSLIAEYKTKYGKDLIKELKSELSGKFEDVCIALMHGPEQYDYEAVVLHQAMKGLGTDEKCLIEVIIGSYRSQYVLDGLKDSYKRQFGKNLEDAIKSETSGTFQRILVSVLNAEIPDDEEEIDNDLVAKECDELFDAGEGRWGTDESTFIQIFLRSSNKHFLAVFDAFIKKTGHDLAATIKKEFSGDAKKSFLAYISTLQNPANYFATCLHDAMAGLGTRDSELIRTIVLTAEVNLQEIKVSYLKKYGRQLREAVAAEVSGDYRKMLLRIIGPDFDPVAWQEEQNRIAEALAQAAAEEAAAAAKLIADAEEAERARQAMEEAAAEAERARVEAERVLQEIKIQVVLKEIGQCDAGFEWKKQSDGSYVCGGGYHTITDAELQKKGIAPPKF